MTSSIQWNWAKCDQTHSLYSRAEKTLKQVLFSEENCAIRAMGLPYVLGDTALILASRVGMVAEPIIKGLGNIFGSRISKDCSLLRGLKFLTIGTLEALLKAAVTTPFLAVMCAVSLVVTPIWVAIAPKDYIIRKLPERFTEIQTEDEMPPLDPSLNSAYPLSTTENPSQTSNET